jgi:type IV secretory pathway ATPase VirB11/archaellum biosynthesis ATPase
VEETVWVYVTVDQQARRHPGDQPVKSREALMRRVIAVAHAKRRRVGDKKVEPSSAQDPAQP